MKQENKKSNDLHDFMVSATHEMQSEYERIQKSSKEDPGTAGDQGEENWANLFRDWLPSNYHIVTKGRILNYKGFTSPQVDVLVLHPTYPQKLLDKKRYLAAGVLAAFECKLTLKVADIDAALKTSAKIRNLLRKRSGTPYKELNSSIIYGLLAHSHCWKDENSTPVDNISKRLFEKDHEIIQHPNEMLDVLCVADLGTWTAVKIPYLGPIKFPKGRVKEIHKTYNLQESKLFGKQGAIQTSYMSHIMKDPNKDIEYTPIGTMITYLLYKLAWEDVSLRSLANYFRLSDMSGQSTGTIRTWKTEIYSKQVKEKIYKSRPVTLPWDEWTQFDFV